MFQWGKGSTVTEGEGDGSEFLRWSRWHGSWFAATVALLALLPWSVAHWPSQDGQNHLAVAHVVMHYDDPGSPFPEYLSIERSFRPSTALYDILCVAARFMPLKTAEKALASLALALLPCSLLILLRRALPRRATNAMLSLPFVSGWAFAMGFLNFQIGLSLAVAMLALGWDDASGAEARGLRARHGVAAVLYFLCVWAHPVASIMAGLALLLLEWRNVLQPAEWPRIVTVLGPGAVFLLGSYIAAGAQGPGPGAQTETHFADWATVLGGAFEYNVAYTPLELIPRLAVASVLLCFAYRGIRANPPHGGGPEAAVGRLFLAFLVLYAVTPSSLHGWGYASTRFFLFAWLLLPAVADIPARVGRRLVVLGPALTVAIVAIQWPCIDRASQVMQDILDVGVSLPRGSRLIPMDFTASVFGPQPLGHAWAELVVDKDAIACQLFAAGKPRMGGERFRTLKFRSGLLDVSSGKLPWSTNESWHDVRRTCEDPSSPVRWFVSTPDTCTDLLEARRSGLETVIDRYDYVLMLDPPPYGRELIAEHLALVSHVGAAWLYAVQDTHAG